MILSMQITCIFCLSICILELKYFQQPRINKSECQTKYDYRMKRHFFDYVLDCKKIIMGEDVFQKHVSNIFCSNIKSIIMNLNQQQSQNVLPFRLGWVINHFAFVHADIVGKDCVESR